MECNAKIIGRGRQQQSAFPAGNPFAKNVIGCFRGSTIVRIVRKILAAGRLRKGMFIGNRTSMDFSGSSSH